MGSGCACAHVRGGRSWPRAGARAAPASAPDPAPGSRDLPGITPFADTRRVDVVLSSATRMRRRQDFEFAVRKGRRAGGPLLTVYLAVREQETVPPLIGFVVSRAVGIAVVRNRVRRRLRHLVRARAERLPAGSLLVIRANPRAADARQRDLAAELDLVLGKLLRRQVRALDRP